LITNSYYIDTDDGDYIIEFEREFDNNPHEWAQFHLARVNAHHCFIGGILRPARTMIITEIRITAFSHRRYRCEIRFSPLDQNPDLYDVIPFDEIIF
jgi:hypothetical protein